MARYPPTRPGWYRNPDEPRSLRYWDGKAWSGRSRARPAWVARAEPFEPEDEEADRSVEGPVHPHELREPVTSGAWSREWLLPWRQPQPESWRGRSGHPSRPMVSARPQPVVRLGPARRPLVLLAALVMVAAAVVVSSVAVMAPYEDRLDSGLPPPHYVPSQTVSETFTNQASKECAETLPVYRAVLAGSVDGPSRLAAANQLDLLRQRLAAISGGQVQVVEWLQAWKNYVVDQRRYASIIGPAEWSHGRLVIRRLPGPNLSEAGAALDQARQEAFKADTEGANLALTTCHLRPGPAA